MSALNFSSFENLVNLFTSIKQAIDNALSKSEYISYKMARSGFGYTPHNFIPDEYDITETTVNGITFKKESDGSITLSGTASSDAIVTIASGIPLGKSNYTYTYYLNLQETDKSNGYVDDSNISMIVSSSSGSGSVNLNNSLAFNVTSAKVGNYDVKLKVKSGTNLLSGVYNVYPAVLWDEPVGKQLETASKKTDEITTNISDADYIPVYITNSVAKGGAKITWTNIKEKLKAYFDNFYGDGNYVSESLLKDTVGWVGKNALYIHIDNVKTSNTSGTWSGNKYTQSGVEFDFSVNEQGFVTGIDMNGTASADVRLRLYRDSAGGVWYKELPKGTYMINGVTGGSDSTYYLQVNKKSSGGTETTGGRCTNGDVSLDTTSSSDNYINYWIDVKNGKTVSHVKVYPMLRDSSIIDSTYEPYHESVDVVKANREELDDTVGWSSKNLLKYPFMQSSKTENGITFTSNPDGSITANGTATGTAIFVANYINYLAIDTSTKYALNGCPSGGDASTYRVDIIAEGGISMEAVMDTGNGAEFSFPAIPSGAQVYMARIRVGSGTTLNNKVFKPMIRKASISDDTYEPYHESVEQTLRDAEVIEGKNKLQIAKNVVSYTASGITVTVNRNTDGEVTSIKFNGTASQNVNLRLFHGVIPSGDYILSKGFNSSTSKHLGLKIEGYNNDTWVKVIGGSWSTDDTPISIDYNGYSSVRITLTTENGDVLSNAIAYPMLRLATETDPTFEPYYTRLKDSKFDRAEQRVLGAKNLLPIKLSAIKSVDTAGTWNGNNYTHNGITYSLTVDDNGYVSSISVSGTASANSNLHLNRNALHLESGIKYFLSGCPSGGSLSSYTLQYTNNTDKAYSDEGNGIEFEKFSSSYTYIEVNINIKNGTAISTPITFKPMIRLASDPDNTYVPYAETNKQLTENKLSYADNGVLGAKNRFYATKIIAGSENGTVNEDGSVLVQNVTEGIWKAIVFEINGIQPNTAYKFSADVDYTSGVGAVSVRNFWGTGSIVLGDYTNIISDKTIEFTFISGQNTHCTVGLFCTGNNSEMGEVKYSKPMLRLATDADPNYVPYAMTNRELTELTTELTRVQESAVTDLPENTVIHDDEMGNHLYKSGNVVELCLSATIPSYTAYSGYIFKIPEEFRPKAKDIRVCDINITLGYVYKWFFGSSSNNGFQCNSTISNKKIQIHATWITG